MNEVEWPNSNFECECGKTAVFKTDSFEECTCGESYREVYREAAKCECNSSGACRRHDHPDVVTLIDMGR